MIMLPQSHEKNRQFICPCTKAYYSYAALFTHIKQKHDGKAPGPIIKPKPQNKRGRPRKTNNSPGPQRRWKDNGEILNENHGLMTNTINLNHVKINNSSSPLKSTPGSQFKYYKADCTQISTTNELPTEISPQNSLLQHFTSNLGRFQQQNVPIDIFDQFQSYTFFIQKHYKSQMLQCLQQFIQFCRQSLKQQIVAQIQLLMIVLLQHVYQSRNKTGLSGLKHIILNDYITSFFQRLVFYIKRWGLQPFPIFQGLNPMKILVVYYNWINNVYINDGDSDGNSFSQ